MKILQTIKKAVCKRKLHIDQRTLVMLAFMALTVTSMVAQETGGAGFQRATQIFSKYEDDVSNLLKAIGLLVGLVGAFNIYFKMQNGDQDVKKSIMMTIGGCVAFIALSEAIPMFFGSK